MKLLYVLLRKVGKKVSSVEGIEEYMEYFLLSSRLILQHRVLVHFFQVLFTWLNPLKLNTFSAFCNESKKSRSHAHSAMAFSFSLKSIDAKMAGQQHLALFIFLSGPCGA